MTSHISVNVARWRINSHSYTAGLHLPSPYNAIVICQNLKQSNLKLKAIWFPISKQCIIFIKEVLDLNYNIACHQEAKRHRRLLLLKLFQPIVRSLNLQSCLILRYARPMLKKQRRLIIFAQKIKVAGTSFLLLRGPKNHFLIEVAKLLNGDRQGYFSIDLILALIMLLLLPY